MVRQVAKEVRVKREKIDRTTQPGALFALNALFAHGHSSFFLVTRGGVAVGGRRGAQCGLAHPPPGATEVHPW